MATGVSMINKDILRYFQTQNLLSPPEAIELTKLYNEMSELLKKPVKFKDEALQLNLFYDMLSQYKKHLSNLKLGTSPEDIPSIPPPPKSETESVPAKKPKSKTPSSASSDKTIAASPDTTPLFELRKTPPAGSSKQSVDEIDDDDLTPTAIPSPPKSALKLYSSLLSPNSDIPDRVLRAIRQNDTTFQVFPDTNEIIIQGRKIPGTYFLDFLTKLRNPEYKAPQRPLIADPHHLPVLEKVYKSIMIAPQKERSIVLKELKGLQNYITRQKSGSRKALTKDPYFSTDVSPIASAPTAHPQNLEKKIGKGKMKKPKQAAVVKWKRWQTRIQAL